MPGVRLSFRCILRSPDAPFDKRREPAVQQYQHPPDSGRDDGFAAMFDTLYDRLRADGGTHRKTAALHDRLRRSSAGRIGLKISIHITRKNGHDIHAMFS